jgi:DNA-binding transcriptional ArsR family regulator
MNAIPLPDVSDLADLGRFLVALGDPTRQQIVLLLSRARLNVGELAERFQLSRPAISHHLKVLADAGLLAQERRSRERLYRLDAKRCRSFVDRLRAFVSSCCRDSQCC